ncbi:4-hydroxy-tetrahydrodipicolinate reductase [Halobacteriales archaeon Cl-PHB]
MTEAVTLGINGVAGRMGQTLVETAVDRTDVSVAFGLDVDTDADVDVPVSAPDDAVDAFTDHDPDAVVDFTVPEATLDLAAACREASVPLVVGTTGLEEAGMDTLREVSESIPVLKATNFSRGIQALLRALQPALDALPDYDVELQETHHNAKRDAPSGTANTILETIQAERDLDPVYGREGIQPREDDEIGVLVSRLGDVRGEHEVRLGDNDEVLTLAHRAEDRAVFAAGALDAAAWLATQNPGWYTFGDVIDSQ